MDAVGYLDLYCLFLAMAAAAIAAGLWPTLTAAGRQIASGAGVVFAAVAAIIALMAVVD